MTISMTGFGRETFEFDNKKINVDIRTLNSKICDINIRIPNYYKEKEIAIRQLLSQKLARGKIDLSISEESKGTNRTSVINQEVVVNYYNQLQSISDNNNIPLQKDILSTIINMPDVMTNITEELSDEEWSILESTITKAIDKCIAFRTNEGKELEKDIIKNINSILLQLEKIPQYEQERISNLRERLKRLIEDSKISTNANDKNRLEQEIIYYIEKLDINEEKVRLKKHCEHFLETISNESVIGKKLGFISQEIGREINTIGSKANHVEIQKIVIAMKEELEKIKEQVLNIL